VRTVGFGWTTAYGLYPMRALRWILLLGAVLTPVYMFVMLHPTAVSGILRIFPAGRLEGTVGHLADEEKPKKQLVKAKSWRAALRTAAYFSIVSAVSISVSIGSPQVTGFVAYKPANIHLKRSAGCGSSQALRHCSVCTYWRCGC
jgi:hypothetical protein